MCFCISIIRSTHGRSNQLTDNVRELKADLFELNKVICVTQNKAWNGSVCMGHPHCPIGTGDLSHLKIPGFRNELS